MPAAPGGPGPDTVYLRWIWCRAVLHRGWWLVTGVYLVVDAHLPASELVLVGTVALRPAQPHIDEARATRRGYLVACGVAAVGVLDLAGALGTIACGLTVAAVARLADPPWRC